MKLVIILFAAINVFTFLLMGYDKRQAVAEKWRVSEKTLLALAICGGAIGEVLGGKFFHHKTRKPIFRIAWPIAIVINVLMYYFLINGVFKG